jgi:pimeloyl-ACP methyl ester carboxylesterase
VAGLAALSPWTTLAEVARAHVPFGLSGLFLRERYDSLAAAGRVRVPALVVHGRYDTIIPFDHGRRLAAALPPETTRFVAVESGHNDLFAQEVVWRELEAFVDRVAVDRGSPPEAESRRDDTQ